MTQHRRSPLRGFSWPVSTKDLELALGDLMHHVSVVWHEREGKRGPEGEILTVNWQPRDDEDSGDFWARQTPASVWLLPVAAEQERARHELFTNVVLPELRSWLADALAQPPEWQVLRHSCTWFADGDEVRTWQHDQSRKRLRKG